MNKFEHPEIMHGPNPPDRAETPEDVEKRKWMEERIKELEEEWKRKKESEKENRDKEE